jgi:DNA mismatch repair protein MutL
MTEPDATADIHELDAQTVERIAAGEVVERPASVVKELVENAIDADASRVDVTVEDGGTELIRVADDGVGMTENDVRTAVREHTTSKITDIDDLESGVATLGFRGEAIHAIGAVSRVTITTRPRRGDRGTELVLEGGEVTSVSPAGCPEGTTVEVRDLFFNVPARRKYLKQPSTEFAHVNAVVTGYALANPDVAVSLTHGDRETFATTGAGDLREAVLSVYGRDVARSMIPVDPGELPEGPLEGISGLVSHPETNRASRDYLNTFVNGRYVTANSVRNAVVEAYDTQLAPDRYPFAVLDLSVDPGAVDVNVHPRKLEVRFADEEGLRTQVEAAVSAALMREGLLRSGAPRGKSAPEQTEITPERVADGRVGGRSREDDWPTEDGLTGDRPTGDAAAPTDAREAPSGSVPSSASTDTDAGGPRVSAHEDPSAGVEHVDDATDEDDSRSGTAGRDARGSTADPHEALGTVRDRGDQTHLGDGEAPSADYDSLPSMTLLGQFRETYVVAETDDGLVLIDQHAADERVNYERLKARFTGEVTTQALAEPVELDLTAGEAAMAADRTDALARLGFQTDLVDDRTVRISAVPSLVAETAEPALLRDVLGSLLAGERSAAETVEAAADDLLADLACYPSITGNTSLTEGSIRDLLAALDDCENPWACPHGRPVVVAIDDAELEGRFERDYPGHGG